MIKAKTGFKLYHAVMLGIESVHDWCHQMMWLFSHVPRDPEDTVMEKHGAEALYSAVKFLMHTLCTQDEASQQDVVHQIIQITNSPTITRWSGSKLANGNH